jgi:hypothetical protein
MPEKKSGSVWAILVAACFAVALFFLIYPVYVIRPFRYQGARELMVALDVLSVRPAITLAAVALSILAFVRYWRLRPSRVRRVFAVIALTGTIVFAALCRVNVYEKMFHPMDRPQFTPVAETKLDGREKVLAVRIADAARGYPIRSISYHHIVNDTVGGVPIVATY